MSLPRFHLFEWEDQPWLPRVFRDFITDHLRYIQNEPMRHEINVAIASRLKGLVEASGSRIVDLCAGAGGPLVSISRILSEEFGCAVDVLLTDFYPNVEAFKRIEKESAGRIKARYESTSALEIPADLGGVRTMFTALHHFRPEQARRVLADAARNRSAIAIFEPLERSVRIFVLAGLMLFLRGFTHTPRVGRLTPSRFFFTYVVPIAPAIFAWDGMVSTLRTYTPEELKTLALSAASDGTYKWEAGKFEVSGPYGPMPTTYLIGTPI